MYGVGGFDKMSFESRDLGLNGDFGIEIPSVVEILLDLGNRLCRFIGMIIDGFFAEMSVHPLPESVIRFSLCTVINPIGKTVWVSDIDGLLEDVGADIRLLEFHRGVFNDHLVFVQDVFVFGDKTFDGTR